MLEERNIYPGLTDSCFGCVTMLHLYTHLISCALPKKQRSRALPSKWSNITVFAHMSVPQLDARNVFYTSANMIAIEPRRLTEFRGDKGCMYNSYIEHMHCLDECHVSDTLDGIA